MKKVLCFLMVFISTHMVFANDSTAVRSTLDSALDALQSRPNFVPESVAIQCILHPRSIDTVLVEQEGGIADLFYPFGNTMRTKITGIPVLWDKNGWHTKDAIISIAPDPGNDRVFSIVILGYFVFLLLYTYLDRWFFIRRYNHAFRTDSSHERIMEKYHFNADPWVSREFIMTLATWIILFVALGGTVLEGTNGMTLSFSMVQIPLWLVIAAVIEYQLRRLIVRTTIRSIERKQQMIVA